MNKCVISGDNKNTYVSNTIGSGYVRSNVAVDDEDIIKFEILSRLPVKSLMRFKCVSKTWLSLIQEDPYFVDLHFERSKARPALLLVIPLPQTDPDNPFRISNELVLTASLSRDRSKAEIYSILNTQAFSCAEIRGPVNGLVCFIDRLRSNVHVYNISTREVTCVRSTFMPKVCFSFGWTNWYGYEIGFDPVSKKHKVLCVCRKNQQPGQNHFGDQHIYCEVLTVGDNAWRRIDKVPPCDFSFFGPVYVNGFIYYCTSKFLSGNWDNGDAVFVAFDVGNEKFRVITIPNLILMNRSSDRYQCINLLEVDGHAAIVSKESDYIIKLWLYREYNEYDNKWKKTKTRSSSNLEENWTEDTITLPSSWDYNLHWDFYTGAGMHQLLVQSVQRLDRGINSVTLYSYDLKKKTFTEIEVSGIPSSIPNGRCINSASTFVESLFPIQKRRNAQQ
ncbi:hypothetical protein MKW98_029465 [Papaver atlanticum]|uniref:F-box domain-containing protein n=1 Tax=Papaver atlanticum TaxID=357466 RepID=A0AAD4XG86_9MAGN|nr:hypothetical protein MKW98_029465 [Papaver atlanticum]